MSWFWSALGAFIAMEAAAWATHKYVMHGIGWVFHRDHHQPQAGFFEKNDTFFLVFAIPSFLGLFIGLSQQQPWLWGAGAGIAAYGICYFLVHDVFIHQRLPWFKHTNNVYFRAIRKAHKVHHKHLGPEQGECFGMLLVPMKYLVEAWRTR